MSLKARHLSGSAFCTGFSRLEVPEQALDGIPLGLGLVVKINLLNFHVHRGVVRWCLIVPPFFTSCLAESMSYHLRHQVPQLVMLKAMILCEYTMCFFPLTVADFSDYKEHKITEENVGFKLLQKAGWTEGVGLGANEDGITAPINKLVATHRPN